MDTKTGIKIQYLNFFRHALPTLDSLSLFYLAIAFLWLRLWISSDRKYSIEVLFIPVLIGYMYFISYVTYTMMKFPPRVAWPLFMTNALFIIALMRPLLKHAHQDIYPRHRNLLAALAIGFLAAAILTQIGHYRATYEKKKEWRATFSSFLEELHDFDPNAIVLAQPGLLYFDSFDPLFHYRTEVRFINIGWNTQSPRFYQQISFLGATKGSEIIEKIEQHPNAYIMARPDWMHFLDDHYIKPYHPEYHPEAVTEKVFSGNSKDITLYRITRYITPAFIPTGHEGDREDASPHLQ